MAFIGRFVALLFVTATLATADSARSSGLNRTWTSKDGATVDMELRSIDGSTAVFLSADSRKIELPLSRLSDADQLLAREWWDALPRPLVWPEIVEVETRTLEVLPLPKEAREGWYLYRTEHFEFHSQAELANSLVKDIARVFEATLLLVEELPWSVDPSPATGTHYLAELYQSRASYVQAGGPSNSGGVYSPKEKKFMVPFESLGVKRVGGKFTRADRYEVDTLVHEITHQAMHFWLNFLPKWYIEGTAEFTELIPYHYGKFRLDRIEVGLKEYLEERSGSIYPIQELFTMGHQKWAEISTDYATQSRLYTSSLILTYYFMHLDGDGDGARIQRYLGKVDKLRASWQTFSDHYKIYEDEFAVFLKNPGVVDNSDGTFTYPTSLTPPARPALPLPKDQMDKADIANLDLLLDGRTPAELEEEMRVKYREAGFRGL